MIASISLGTSEQQSLHTIVMMPAPQGLSRKGGFTFGTKYRQA